MRNRRKGGFRRSVRRPFKSRRRRGKRIPNYGSSRGGIRI